MTSRSSARPAVSAWLGKFLGLLDAIEALFLENQLGHAVVQEGNAAVVSLGYDPENSQGLDTAAAESEDWSAR